jgi:hypothetical protein
LGGTQSLHTNSMDETLALPSEKAAKIALRTQQLIAYETGVAEVIEYYSSMMTLEPGFLICPGTPGGCAVGSDPDCGGRSSHAAPGSEYLLPGQVVTVEIGGIGQDIHALVPQVRAMERRNVSGRKLWMRHVTPPLSSRRLS